MCAAYFLYISLKQIAIANESVFTIIAEDMNFDTIFVKFIFYFYCHSHPNVYLSSKYGKLFVVS